jgi:hypothetical protein
MNSYKAVDLVINQILDGGATKLYDDYLKPKVKPFGANHSLNLLSKVPIVSPHLQFINLYRSGSWSMTRKKTRNHISITGNKR